MSDSSGMAQFASWACLTHISHLTFPNPEALIPATPNLLHLLTSPFQQVKIPSLVSSGQKPWSSWFYFYPISNLSGNTIGCTFKIEPAFSHFFAFIVIITSPHCHQLPWIIAVALWLSMEGYFLSPKEDICQWMEFCFCFVFQLEFILSVSLYTFRCAA